MSDLCFCMCQICVLTLQTITRCVRKLHMGVKWHNCHYWQPESHSHLTYWKKLCVSVRWQINPSQFSPLPLWSRRFLGCNWQITDLNTDLSCRAHSAYRDSLLQTESHQAAHFKIIQWYSNIRYYPRIPEHDVNLLRILWVLWRYLCKLFISPLLVIYKLSSI